MHFEGKFYDSKDANAPKLDQPFDGTQPGLVLTLPEDIKFSDLKWIAVWCRRYSMNFGDFIFEDESNSLDETVSSSTNSDNEISEQPLNLPKLYQYFGHPYQYHGISYPYYFGHSSFYKRSFLLYRKPYPYFF